ncbi:MAG: enoyl-CoA hydratase/ 3-hydroxyacyl-CoA dehydrogenase/3-hydroxybutyryl-CoA epimerase [Rhodanobacteraceae bacterium]|nr:MAG: enoyl-CoA hydratase/ 3-hydroxyacyl-CoA dehydrogenase/3-hydroxybutyryl-CoA epimerase [Rhodanobacteraceae bacterium]
MFEGLRLSHWKVARGTDGVLMLTMDRNGSNVNALSRALLDELDAMLERVAIERPAAVVIHSGKASGFAVGADLKEFESYDRKGTVREEIEHGQRVFERLAQLPMPTVAAIHGACMGGGTELALACRMRVAARAPETRIALPEVLLGIHPGWGGTARLPRLIGAPKALAMMLTGRTASAERALAEGLVNRLAGPDALLDEARELALHPVTRSFAQRALAWWTNCWPARQILAPIVRKQASAKAPPKHYPAPSALIEVWRRGGGDIAQRLKLEARSVAKLASTPTAHNLIRIFFLRERLRGLAGDTPHGIRHVHVIGAGVMGGDIAAWSALRGFEVTLQDREMKFIEPALARARKLFDKKLKTRERIAPVEARLTPDVEGAGVTSSQLAIEAIYEDPQAKEAVYRALEPKIARDALIATNTSSIPLDELRVAFAEPRRFLGLHFFNPVAQMPLVEVVRHDALDPSIEKRAWAWVKAIGKLPLPVKGTPGFLVNRILVPYLLEAVRCHTEGIPDPVIDRAGKRFGMPMGPIELIDTVGLDVALSVGKELGPFLNLELPAGIADKIEGGKRGKKDGQGFYTWKDGKPEKPKVDSNYRAPVDLEDRLILPMLNEAVACLRDGVVTDADLLDAGVIFGTGFAPFRGGPIQYIRATGAGVLREKLEALAQTHGARFAPKQGWFNPALAASGN